MKLKILGLISILVFVSNCVFAEAFSVSAGIPVSYGLSKKDMGFSGVDKVETDGRPTGTLFHVKFPILVGIGLEQYEQKLSVGKTKLKLTTEMYDVFYLLPLPILNVTFGLGTGTAKVEFDESVSSSGKNETAKVFQHYIQLGFPIFGVMDIHVAWHQIQTGTKGKLNGSEYTPAGNMYSLGVQVGL